jgi:hypothetical protein
MPLSLGLKSVASSSESEAAVAARAPLTTNGLLGFLAAVAAAEAEDEEDEDKEAEEAAAEMGRCCLKEGGRDALAVAEEEEALVEAVALCC